MDGAVQVQTGLKKFFIYFVISAGLGLFLNSVIQKYTSGVWAQWETRLKDQNIVGSAPTIVFSRYGWPVVGAHVASATYQSKFKCYDLTVKVQDVFVPLPLYRMLLKQLRFGSVDVAKMDFILEENQTCASAESLPDGDLNVDEVIGEPIVASASHPEWFALFDKWFSSNKELAQKLPLSEMKVHQISFTGSTKNGKTVLAKGDAEFSFSEALKLDIHFNPIVFKRKERTLSTNFKATLIADPEKILMSGDWAYDEGHFLLDLNYKKDGEGIEISLKTKDLPMSVVNRWFDTPWAFQFLWFNCQVELATNKAEWNQSPWAISGCQISGPQGQAKVTTSSVLSLRKPQDIAVQIYNFDLDKVIKGTNSLMVSGIFKSLGIIDGQAQVGHNKFNSNLNFKNAQIVFSRRNKRKLQVIEEMKLEASYNRGVYSVLLNSAKIHKGQFEGFIALDYNKALKRSTGKISMGQLSFSPEIQSLMWEGQFSPFLLSGEIGLDSQFKIDFAKMNLSFKKFEGQGIHASSGALLMEWRDVGGYITGSLAQLAVERKSGYPWFFATFLDEGVNRDVLTFARVFTQGHFEKSHMIIDKIVATAANQRMEMSADITKDQSEGRWAWGTAPKNYEWKWIYQNQQFTLIPLLPSMKEWLKLNDSYIEEYPFIRLGNSDI